MKITWKLARRAALAMLLGALVVLIAPHWDAEKFRTWLLGAAIPTDAEGFWGMIGAVLSAAVLWAAIRGLKSLKLTRESMLTQANRDARATAITRCEEFARDIIPMNVPIINTLAALQIPVFVEDAEDVKFDPDNEGELDRAVEWFMRLPADTQGASIEFLNRLEAWAMYFTNQLADPSIAFGPCASYYCSRVVQFYAYLLIARNTDESSGKYPNLIRLYKVWLAELEEEKRGLMAGHLLERLEALQAEGSRRKTTLQPPLGTQLDL